MSSVPVGQAVLAVLTVVSPIIEIGWIVGPDPGMEYLKHNH